MRRLVWVLALLPVVMSAAGGPIAAELSEQIQQAGLDAKECYRIREINFGKEDLHLYLTDGYLIFGKPVRGKRLSAVFSGRIEGGDGELLLMPPSRTERFSLATFIDSPNLDEHFRFALMIFSDDTAKTLLRLIHSRPRVRKSPEMGMILQQKWDSVVRNFSGSFGDRLIYDVLSHRPASEGFFYAMIEGARHGTFDVVYDPVSREQIRVGQVHYRDNHTIFNVWTSFQSRAFRRGIRKREGRLIELDDYRIKATLEPDLSLHAITKATLRVLDHPQRVLYFDLSPRVQVDEVLINGEPGEIWQRSSLRADLFRGGSGLFLVVAPQLLEPGRYSIEFRHHGRVVTEASKGVYYVGARSSWYPYNGVNFTNFDVSFRYPKDLDLVFAGDLVEDRREGNWHITRRKTENPIRVAGFNVGHYKKVEISRPDCVVEVFANRYVEQALRPKSRVMIVPRNGAWPGHRRPYPGVVVLPQETEQPDPTVRLMSLAQEVADAFEFMEGFLGPPPVNKLMVSPIPGNFGQGFPGLLYLSTLAYLEPAARPRQARDKFQNYFYSEILHAHETAHQWWGNVVASRNEENPWLMEALANYTALLLLEKRKGPSALESVLDQYREHLLARNKQGKTLESAGPISWGLRLNSSQAKAWRTITYEKGSWVIHMLRRRLGDTQFRKMLGDLCRRYRFRSVSVKDFRRHVARYLPPGAPDRTLTNFFDQWVYDIGIPTLKFTHRVRGRPPHVRVTGVLTQSGVADYFSTYVPVEIQFAKGKPITRWLETGEEPATLDITLRRRPARIIFNPGDSVLAVTR